MKKSRKAFSVFLVMVLLLISIYVPFSVNAVTYPAEGIINGTAVRMRSSADTSTQDNIVCTLSLNQNVTVTGETTDSSGDLWYTVTLADGTTGCVFGEYVTVKEPIDYIPNGGVGIVNDNGINVRKGPGTNNAVLVTVPGGLKVNVIGRDNDKAGVAWYHITFNYRGVDYDGYMRYDFVSKYVSYEPEADFEEYLTSQGFPESYKVKLRELHAQYPNWIFTANHLSMTFAQAHAAESQLFRNLASHVSPESWFVMDEGAYDWSNGSYISGDSGSWYAVHPDVVAYYLDPRNFIDVASIFQFVGMSYNHEHHTKEAVQNVLKGTFMEGAFPEDGFETWADVLIDVAQQTGMSPVSLASMIIIEQGSNGAGGCISNNSGYYNFLNINAYSTGSGSAVQNGIAYAKSKGWNTRYKSILGGAAFYVKNYISYGQDTLYFKKFNVVAEPFYGHQYMTNIQGAYSEASKEKEAYASMMDAALLFEIPVYKDMPEEISPYPISVGNNNFYLSSLTVQGYDINQSFYLYTDSYELIVEGEVSEIEISATPKNASATVSGTGKHALNVGSNAITVTVTATSGRTKDYTISVFRKDPPAQTPTTPTTPTIPTISNEIYKTANGYLTGVSVDTTVDVLKANLNVSGGSIEVLKPDGQPADGKVGTGFTVRILNNLGDLYTAFNVVIKGDINGDGRISIVDLARVQRHLLEIDILQGAYAQAADINGDGRLSIVDLARVQRHLLDIEHIKH